MWKPRSSKPRYESSARPRSPTPKRATGLGLVRAEDAPDRAAHLVHVVAAGDVAEGPEAGEVAAELGRRHADELGELLGVDVLHPFAVELLQRLAVHAEALDGLQ